MMKLARILRSAPLLVLTAVVLLAVLALVAGGATGQARIVASIWVLGFAAWTSLGMIRDLLAGHLGLDVLAVVAMGATIAVDEYIAAVLIVLMVTGGEALETYAAGRARSELDALLAREPRQAHRIVGDAVHQVPIGQVAVGDLLLVKSAEVVPVDGTLIDDAAQTDESSLTGESMPVEHAVGETILSGSINLGGAIRLRAAAIAADSQYQQIFALVRQAQESKAPVVRLADRFAVPFTAVSLLIAGVAWYLAGDATRFAEVLVLATPCPLLIGAPVAIISGMSRSAHQGIIVKSGAALEQLSRARTAAFDKTGTLTTGRPSLSRVLPAAGHDPDDLLQLVASAEQYSTHALAPSVIRAAQEHGVSLLPVEDATETATDGIEASVDGRIVLVGKPRFIAERTGDDFDRPALDAGELAIHAGVDGRFVGSLIMRDPLRSNAAALIGSLRSIGVENTMVLTGDARATAAHVGSTLGLTQIRAELLPTDKVSIVHDATPKPVVMVGDGVNDAPVLAAADVGIAMGARGATAASESADVVILADDIGKVATAISIAKHTVRIAFTSIGVGIALSLVLMVIAAFGYIPAVVGALTQEIVDLVAIGVALTALRPGRLEIHP